MFTALTEYPHADPHVWHSHKVYGQLLKLQQLILCSDVNTLRFSRVLAATK